MDNVVSPILRYELSLRINFNKCSNSYNFSDKSDKVSPFKTRDTLLLKVKTIIIYLNAWKLCG